MRSPTLGHFFIRLQPHALYVQRSLILHGAMCYGLGLVGSCACRAALAEGELEAEAITGGCVQVSSTQLDSLLYPRDERSAMWALPCCDLAPFGDSESCTHVDISHNNTAEAFQTACPIQTLCSQPSTQFTFVTHHQQMVFMYLDDSPRTCVNRPNTLLSCRPLFLECESEYN